MSFFLLAFSKPVYNKINAVIGRWRKRFAGKLKGTEHVEALQRYAPTPVRFGWAGHKPSRKFVSSFHEGEKEKKEKIYKIICIQSQWKRQRKIINHAWINAGVSYNTVDSWNEQIHAIHFSFSVSFIFFRFLFFYFYFNAPKKEPLDHDPLVSVCWAPGDTK